MEEKGDKGGEAPGARRAAGDPAAGSSWEARAMARVRPHVEQLSRNRRTLPVGWEADTMTRLEEYFSHEQD